MKYEQVKKEISKQQKQEDKKHSDGCSPFCVCNCCAGFTFNFFPYQIDYLDIPLAKNISVYLPVEVKEISLPIWQPPQL